MRNYETSIFCFFYFIDLLHSFWAIFCFSLTPEANDQALSVLRDPVFLLTSLTALFYFLTGVYHLNIKKILVACNFTRLDQKAIEFVTSTFGHIDGAERELDDLRKEITDLKARKDSSRRSYLSLIKARTGNGPSTEAEEDRRTDAATKAGRLEERIARALSLSPVELLRMQGTMVLNKAMARSIEQDEKRMMSGALDAQMSIIRQLLEQQSCICGTPIRTTGMGKGRLNHLLEKLKERKELECR
mgnify:CR=1 FL=1